MLWHHRRIVVACDDLQFAFQILGLSDEAGFLIAFGVVLWGAHVPFAIHHLIPLPVDDGATSHANLEDLGVVGDQRDGHKPTKRPSVYAQALHIHIGQGTEIIDAFHLVFHLYLSQLVEGGLLEVTSAMLRASVVEDEENIALLRHISLPGTTCPMPGGIHVMGVRSAIDIDHCGVFLAGVEIVRLHHAEIEVCNAVGSLDGTLLEAGLLIVCPRISGIQQSRTLAIGGVQQVDTTGYIWSRIPLS